MIGETPNILFWILSGFGALSFLMGLFVGYAVRVSEEQDKIPIFDWDEKWRE